MIRIQKVYRRLTAIALFICLAAPFIHAVDSAKTALGPATHLRDPAGLHNFFRLSTNLYSGSAPEGDSGFSALKNLGIKTIITVDGTKPDLAMARKYGMRYVHLPHGYDGISTNTQLQLIKASQTLPGPFYIHCHHGKHRGPAAAAVICMANYGWSAAQAEQWLTEAGTATNYIGLFQVVRDFQKPSPGQLALPDDFPETAQTLGLTEAMVAIDQHWDNLKAIRAAGFHPPPQHPDLQPANEAVILMEHYREAQRLPDARERGNDFLERLKIAETEALEAERLLGLFAREQATPSTKVQLDKAFDSLAKSCVSCHKSYRDPAGIKSK